MIRRDLRAFAPRGEKAPSPVRTKAVVSEPQVASDQDVPRAMGYGLLRGPPEAKLLVTSATGLQEISLLTPHITPEPSGARIVATWAAGFLRDVRPRSTGHRHPPRISEHGRCPLGVGRDKSDYRRTKRERKSKIEADANFASPSP